MNGKNTPQKLITPEEAIMLFKHANIEEMYRADDLYNAFRKSQQVRNASFWEFLDKWDLLCLLAFVYDTARVQGIREERLKNKVSCHN